MATLDELVKVITQLQAEGVSKDIAASLAERFERVFDGRTVTLSADRELLDLQQGNQDLVSYLANFNRLLAETSWPEEKQAALFYKGLKDELKDILAHIEPQPTDCQDLINLVLRLDHRLAERRGTRKKNMRNILGMFMIIENRKFRKRTMRNQWKLALSGGP
ncbi:hypothetical protein NDU88_005694 [Pleurodeles waltl]|uniref:Retrotransposon gag domain-containing protein n=1 Tax=Pleurodeles waltl TaxID=8319 RepID=A0AAV7PGF7_PLEWA|nr:hypothetical protein NDU88_005694 [Pleurodeles waltl]